MGLLAKARSVGKKASLAVALAYVFSQGVASYDALRTPRSCLRSSLEAATGVTISGRPQEVERSSRFVFLDDILRSEHARAALPVTTVRVVPQQLWRQRPWEQVLTLLHKQGFASPWSRSVTLFPSWDRATLFHELTHVRSYALIQKNSAFLQEWYAVISAQSGKGYLSLPEQFAVYSRLFGSFVEARTPPEGILRKQGFITPYARTNVLEDQAEIAESILDEPFLLAKHALVNRNAPLISKIRFLEKYELVPADVLAASLVQLSDNGFTRMDATKKKDALENYLAQSEQFLQQHPKSVYALSIVYRRNEIQSYLANPLPLAVVDSIEKAAQKKFEEYWLSLARPTKVSRTRMFSGLWPEFSRRTTR